MRLQLLIMAWIDWLLLLLYVAMTASCGWLLVTVRRARAPRD